MKSSFAGTVAMVILAVLLLARPAVAADSSNSAPPPTLGQLQQELRQQQERILELERLLKQQGLLLEALRQQLAAPNPPAPSSAALASPTALDPAPSAETLAIATENGSLPDSSKPGDGQGDASSQASPPADKSLAEKLKGLGNFHFSGDVRLRYEPFFQGGGFTTRQRERIRARLNITGSLTDEVSGGLSIATGDLGEPNSTNQTLTGFFTRKVIGFDRYYLTYKPKWFTPLSLTAGKFAYPWHRTSLTFDPDINPEGFAQTLSFDLDNQVLKNVTLVGFELPFNEASGDYDSFIFGGQVQGRFKLSDKAGLRLYAAGINFNRADPIAVAVGTGTLRPALPNTNSLRFDLFGPPVGYQSKFLYLDLIAALDYQVSARWPLLFQFDVVNNTRAATRERSGYWGELQLGKLDEQKDLLFGYAFVRIERDAVIGAFNESDLRAATNVRNHRFQLGYQAYKNVSLLYTLWVGRLANPQENSNLVPPRFSSACNTGPFTGCQDPFLKRMQFDVIYKF